MVETEFVQRNHEVDIGPRHAAEPREDEEIPPVAAVEHGGVVVVPEDSHRTGTGLDAAYRGQQQSRMFRVAHGVGADRQPVLVVEQAERRLLAGAEEVGLVGHAAQAHHHVGTPVPDDGHDVQQARPARPEHLVARNDDVAVRRDPVQPEPRLHQRAQGQVALRCHSGGSLSSRTRSNHRNP